MHKVIEPEVLRLTNFMGSSEVLSEAQVAQWRNEGYLLLNGLFEEHVVEQALMGLNSFMSKCGSGLELGDGSLDFPTAITDLDALSMHPNLIRACIQLLGTNEVRLCQAETWKKVGASPTNAEDVKYSNQDQRIHMDYPNHTLLHPTPWDSPEAVECIIYLSHIEDAGGATHVLPRDASLGDRDPLYQWPYCNMPGFGALPWTNDRATTEAAIAAVDPEMAEFREALYAREQGIHYSPGTILLYREDLWHRGTPLKPGATRMVQNLEYKRTDCDWLNHWNAGIAKSMYRRDQYVEKLVARSSMLQRSALGFPAPGHRVWTAPMLQAVERRYAPFGFDIAPYRAAALQNNAAATATATSKSGIEAERA